MKNQINQRWLGIILTFTGLSLLLHILFQVSLQVGVFVAFSTILFSMCFMYYRQRDSEKSNMKRKLKTGLIAGFCSLVVYDFSKWLLSLLDPSPFNPFEAFKHFGVLLTNSNESTFATLMVGTAFHILNGMCFAMAYVFLFPKSRVWKGVLWGCFLETFQLVLYPQWLAIKFKTEFMLISSMGHIFYGMTIALIVQWRASESKKL